MIRYNMLYSMLINTYIVRQDFYSDSEYLVLQLLGELMLSAVKCPKCGNEIFKPCKVLKNSTFCLEAYECDKCNQKFKVSK